MSRGFHGKTIIKICTVIPTSNEHFKIIVLLVFKKISTCSVIFIWVYWLLFLSYKQKLWSRVNSLDATDSIK